MKAEQPSKRRLVVLNGYRVLQVQADEGWAVEKIEKARGVRPGVYELFKAAVADRSQSAAGVVIHVDELHAYLQTDAGLSRHELGAFDQAPPVGDRITVSYDQQGRASFNV